MPATAMPSPIARSSVWLTRWRIASNAIAAEPTRIRIASIAADRFSIFSCPYRWLSSAGASALRTETNATIEATRSMLECTASVRIATEPVTDPAITFSKISAEFEMIDSAAVRSFLPGMAAFEELTGSATPAAPVLRSRDG